MTTQTVSEQLVKYLADAHSIEEQALVQMRHGQKIAHEPSLERALRDHEAETREHEQLVRERLEAHGASPSKVKELVMRMGGVGFGLFAQLQPDTPGKLAAHAYSYEHLELASYELLERVAKRADDERTADVARQIARQERAMGERVASCFDAAADASLREVGADDLRERVAVYLADAHAIEEQAIQLLESGSKIVGDDQLAALMREHLEETRGHERLVRERLEQMGQRPSRLKDAGLRMGAMNWGGFFKAHPDTPGKLAAFAFAFEHLEIGGYELLRRVAERAGDPQTVSLAERILAEERTAARKIEASFDHAAQAALAEQGV